jgi:hypothetical protein
MLLKAALGKTRKTAEPISSKTVKPISRETVKPISMY